eukprot:scaffold1634_cov353-Prasinococcus_capsulatus_cf.AAC.8
MGVGKANAFSVTERGPLGRASGQSSLRCSLSIARRAGDRDAHGQQRGEIVRRQSARARARGGGGWRRGGWRWAVARPAPLLQTHNAASATSRARSPVRSLPQAPVCAFACAFDVPPFPGARTLRRGAARPPRAR